ncbi:MAG: VWA domain-containing protein [Elusimicrobiales bacterium]|nr:VWA domain-containing protein [Elusimicrobiales bacterium]
MRFATPYYFILIIPLILSFSYVFSNSFRKYFKINFPLNIQQPYSLKILIAENISIYGRFISLLLIIVALARPQHILRQEIPPTEGVDIMLVLDTSLSMGAEDLKPNRLEAAKKAAEEFVLKRRNDRIGLVVFGGVGFLSCPLTLDHSAVIGFLKRVQLGMTKSDGTAIGDAILVALNHLKRSKSKTKIMILLTDGRSNTGIVQDPLTSAKLTKEFGIKIYTIGTAKKGPAQIPTGDPFRPYATIEDDLNEEQLSEIANITGGRFYRATSNEELSNIYSEIDSLEKTKFEIRHTLEISDIYHIFLIAAILIIAATIILEKTIFLRIP